MLFSSVQFPLSLLDHIYTTSLGSITNISQPSHTVSDHCIISCVRNVKVKKPTRKSHCEIIFRSFKNYNKENFLLDLSIAPFYLVYNCTDPDTALSVWYSIFLPILDKHAPLRCKRVKHPKLPPWLEKDIITAMSEREKTKRGKTI